MAASFELVQLSHLNAICDGYESTIAHFRDVVGMQLNLRIPAREGDDTDACLMSLGRVMVEFFCPRTKGERGQGGLLARKGEHWVGVEYEIPDIDRARAVCRERDIRVIRDEAQMIMTHPGPTHGISLELYTGNFYGEPFAGNGPDGGPAGAGFDAMHEAEYWRHHHPLGIRGLVRYSVVVSDLEEAVARFTDVTASEVRYRTDRPESCAVAAGITMGDDVVELLAPAGEGPVAAHLETVGEGIRAPVFSVDDLGAVERHFAAHGISLVPGDGAGVLAVPADRNHGLIFEFSEDEPASRTD